VIAPHKVFGEVEGSSLKRKAYACILSWIIDALRTVGVDAYLYGSNDVLYDGKKIVGNAQKPLQKVLLQHGSLFYASTADEWSAYLRIPENKLEGIQNICSLGVKRDSLKTALFNAFTSNDLVRCVTVESLSDAEYARACELVDMRYAISFEDESDARSGTICALDIQED
jgi:lipoate-protein ligase A